LKEELELAKKINKKQELEIEENKVEEEIEEVRKITHNNPPIIEDYKVSATVFINK